MGRHVIRYDPFDPASIRLAEREYRRLLKRFDRKVDEFLLAIAELGRDTAQAAYGGGAAVTVEQIPNGYAIIAAGKGVVFLEFGAGDTVNTANRYANMMPFEVRSGAYSEQNYDANNNSPRPSYHLDGKWEFGGVEYTQITPTNAMQTTYDTIMEQWRSIAERIFST